MQPVLEANRDLAMGGKRFRDLTLSTTDKLALYLACGLPLPAFCDGDKDAWERLNEVRRRSRRLSDLLQLIFCRRSLWPDAEESGGVDLTAKRSPSRQPEIHLP